MSKTPKKRGRKPAENPQRHQVAFRVDEEAFAAIGRLRDKMGVVSLSESGTVRELLLRTLKKEGLL